MNEETTYEKAVREDPEGMATEKFVLDILENICAEMDHQSISERDLAKKLGVDTLQICKWLEGPDDLTIRTVFRLAWAVGIELGVYNRKGHAVVCTDYKQMYKPK